jgi:hypothetical protein
MWLFLFAYEEAFDFDNRPAGATCFVEGREETSLLQQEEQGFEVMTVMLIIEQNRVEGRRDFSLLQVGVLVWFMQV